MTKYTKEEGRILLDLADKAIKFGLENGEILKVKLNDYSEKLQANGASFVTLEIEGQLRGCIGTLKAYQPLIQDIAQNAYEAAFEDTRFEPVTSGEYKKLEKHISILSKPVSVDFTSEYDLIKKLRPGIDGLILSDKEYKGTFLPSVWQELPDPKLFLQHLKLKAGLPKNYWSDTMRAEKYVVQMIG